VTLLGLFSFWSARQPKSPAHDLGQNVVQIVGIMLTVRLRCYFD